MHSAWNSCPHGKLITLLCPFTYSSRQTTHSTCLPLYLRFHSDGRDAGFSLFEDSTLDGPAGSENTPDILRDRVLDRDALERFLDPSSGEVGKAEPGLADRVEPAEPTEDDEDDEAMV